MQQLLRTLGNFHLAGVTLLELRQRHIIQKQLIVIQNHIRQNNLLALYIRKNGVNLC